MMYACGEQRKEIDYALIDRNCMTVGLLTMEQFQDAARQLGVSGDDIALCRENGGNTRGRLYAYDHYSFGIISVLNPTNIEGEEDRIGILLGQNLLLVIDIADSDQSTTRLFEAAMEKYQSEKITVGRLIYAFLDAVLEDDLLVLDQYEAHIDRMEEMVVDGTAGKQFGKEIFSVRRSLLDLRNYYEQLISFCSELEANENNLFNESDLRYFGMATGKAVRLMNTVQMLRESLVQVRETYSMALDNRMNQVMQLFTVITATFLPLSLIAGWYGMNFKNMPELSWRYGYVGVICIAVAIVTCIIWFFKKKKYF